MSQPRPNLLMLGPIPSEKTQEIEACYEVYKLWQADDPEKLISEVKNDIQGLISTPWYGAGAKLIEAFPNLEIISHFGVGYDNVDVVCAKSRGISVTNTPDVLTDDTADMALGLMLGVLRRLIEGDMYVRTGQWKEKGPLPLGRSLRGRKLGILGLGRIGRAIAHRAEAFGMEIAYHGPSKKSDVSFAYYTDLIEMAKDVDVLMLACPGGEATKYLVNAGVLEALGPQSILINIARGSVVEELALVSALANKQIAGAGLDVFENEPNVPGALFRMDNVVLQPHQGSATIETRAAMGQLVLDNLNAHFAGERLLTPV